MFVGSTCFKTRPKTKYIFSVLSREMLVLSIVNEGAITPLREKLLASQVTVLNEGFLTPTAG
jgi:hypothetical protein